MSVSLVTSTDEGSHELLYGASEDVNLAVKMRDTGGGGLEFLKIIYLSMIENFYLFVAIFFYIYILVLFFNPPLPHTQVISE